MTWQHRYSAQRIEKIAAGLLLVIVFGQLGLPMVGGFLIVADTLQRADALVPLAGEPARVAYAAQLFRQGYARWFIVTSMQFAGAATWHQYADKVVSKLLYMHVPEDSIEIAPGAAATTYDEAIVLRRMVQAHGWHSLLVVTSPSHTRRARMIFQEVFERSGVSIIVRPITDQAYTAGDWWKSANGIQQALLEYLKLAMYLGGYHKLFPGSIQGG
jgi:hypothetical protein